MAGPRKRLALDLPEQDDLLGATLGGRYQVLALLGRGGMGTVYRVRHAVIGRTFALKVLRREIIVDPESVRRFMQEARLTASIDHENIVEVIDFGEVTAVEAPALGQARQPYFVMELLEGETLAERIDRHGPLSGVELAPIGAQAAAALAAAHQRGVVHRDLKPENLFLLRRKDGSVRVKVLDFGVAKLVSGAKFTRKGVVFGTPYYMSPEQAAGGDIDGRADQYALGVVMYEALSGRVPFDDDSHMGVMTKHLFEDPEPVERVVVDPAKLVPMAPIVMRCLAKRPEQRFADMLELARALRGQAASVARPTLPMTGGPPLPAAPLAPTLQQLPAGRPRSSRLPWLAGGLSCAAVALGGYLLVRSRPPPAAPDTAPPPPSTPEVTASARPAAVAPPDLTSSSAPAPSASASARASASATARSSGPGPRAAPPAPTTKKTVDRDVW